MKSASKNNSTSPNSQSNRSNRTSVENFERRIINEGTKLVAQPSYTKPPRKE